MTNTKILEDLIIELEAANQQLKLYQNNKTGLKAVPKALAGRIEYLRSYVGVINKLEELTKNGQINSLVKRLQTQYFGLPR